MPSAATSTPMSDELLAFVGRELRNPLTSMRGALGLIEQGAAGPLSQDAVALVAVARKNLDRLTRLADDLLELDKLRTGKITFNLERTSIALVIAGAIEASRDALPEGMVDAGIDVVFVDGADAIEVMADEVRLIQAIEYLCADAFDAAASSGRLRCEIDRVGPASVRVAITAGGVDRRERDEPRAIWLSRSAEEGSAASAVASTRSTLAAAIAHSIIASHDGESGVEAVERGVRHWLTLAVASGPSFSASRLVDSSDRELESALAQLRADYTPTLGAALAALLHALDRCAAGDHEPVDEARALSHKLRGTAGSYGFTLASESAGAVEDALNAETDGQLDDRHIDWAALRRSVGDAIAALPAATT